jgi:hypothetical protein
MPEKLILALLVLVSLVLLLCELDHLLACYLLHVVLLSLELSDFPFSLLNLLHGVEGVCFQVVGVVSLLRLPLLLAGLGLDVVHQLTERVILPLELLPSQLHLVELRLETLVLLIELLLKESKLGLPEHLLLCLDILGQPILLGVQTLDLIEGHLVVHFESETIFPLLDVLLDIWPLWRPPVLARVGLLLLVKLVDYLSPLCAPLLLPPRLPLSLNLLEELPLDELVGPHKHVLAETTNVLLITDRKETEDAVPDVVIFHNKLLYETGVYYLAW